MRANGFRRTLPFLLTLSILIQLGLSFSHIILPLQARLRTVSGSPILERSARLSFGDTFFEYVEFVKMNVPESGRVVLPPVSIDSTYGNQGIMQFFLFPRSTTNCPDAILVEECLQTFRGESTYFLYIEGFPAEGAASRSRELLLFDDHQGLYEPPER